MKTLENYLAYAVLVFVIVTLIFSLLPFFNFSNAQKNIQSSDFADKNFDASKMSAHLSRMPLTAFDIMLAKQFMDKDGNGKCDACGMDVNLCIESGQLQCNMDPKSTIGVLGSAHIHADFKVYINGKPINFATPGYDMKSSFIHVDDSQDKSDASGVLHMHAKGVPLWLFFKSIGMDLNKDCITVENKEKFCSDSKSTLKFYVNGKSNNEFGNYVFSDLDKLLVSYGSVNEDIQMQLASVTNFAKDHKR